jgi:phosphatidylserine/phosphatidylglycerophosphate/cardiolipin synthase-like enzyme
MTAGDIRVVVSGSSWMGGGFGAIETALRTLFNRADNEIIIVAYAVSSAAPALFQLFSEVLERGIRVRMLINRYNGQHPTVRNELEQLQRQYPGLLQLYSFVPPHDQADLHAKIILIDRKYALVGSANLSLRGLMDNHEIGLVLEGPAVTDIASAVDLILRSKQAVDVHP